MDGMIVALTLFAAAEGPYLASEPYVGSPTPTHCQFEVDGTRTTIPVMTSDLGLVCTQSVAELKDGLHIGRARYQIRSDGQVINGPWNQKRDFWISRVDGTSYWSWQSGIKCGSNGCERDR